MNVWVMKCDCDVHRERTWTFYVDREMSVPEAREWIQKETSGYAGRGNVYITKIEVHHV
jgi:hypothetical protein